MECICRNVKEVGYKQTRWEEKKKEKMKPKVGEEADDIQGQLIIFIHKFFRVVSSIPTACPTFSTFGVC